MFILRELKRKLFYVKMLKHVVRTVVDYRPTVRQRKSATENAHRRRRFSAISVGSNTMHDKIVYRTRRGRLQSFSWPSSVIEPQVSTIRKSE